MNSCASLPPRRPATKLRKWLRKNKSSKRRRPPARPPFLHILFASPRPTAQCVQRRKQVSSIHRKKVCASRMPQRNSKESDSALFLPLLYARHAYVHATTRTQTHKPRTRPTPSRPGTQAAREAAQTNTLKIQTTRIPNTPAP